MSDPENGTLRRRYTWNMIAVILGLVAAVLVIAAIPRPPLRAQEPPRVYKLADVGEYPRVYLYKVQDGACSVYVAAIDNAGIDAVGTSITAGQGCR